MKKVTKHTFISIIFNKVKPMSDTNGKILQQEPGMSSDAVMSIAKYPRQICEYGWCTYARPLAHRWDTT